MQVRREGGSSSTTHAGNAKVSVKMFPRQISKSFSPLEPPAQNIGPCQAALGPSALGPSGAVRVKAAAEAPAAAVIAPLVSQLWSHECLQQTSLC